MAASLMFSQRQPWDISSPGEGCSGAGSEDVSGGSEPLSGGGGSVEDGSSGGRLSG